MGGSDDPSNLVELTPEEHAEAHRKLYEERGMWQDYLAWKGLEGRMTSEECAREAARQANLGSKQSEATKAKRAASIRKAIAEGRLARPSTKGMKYTLEHKAKIAASMRGNQNGVRA